MHAYRGVEPMRVTKASAGATAALLAVGGAVGYAIAAPGDGPTTAEKPRVVVHTQVIRQTVHKVHHRKPKHRRSGGGGKSVHAGGPGSGALARQ